MMKIKMMFVFVLLSVFAIAQDTTLVLPGALGIQITVPIADLDSSLVAIVDGVTQMRENAVIVAEVIKEEDPKTTMDWIMLLLTGGLLPIVTSIIGQVTKLVRNVTGLFKGDRTLAVIGGISGILSAGYTLFLTGFDLQFFSVWPGVFLFALGGSVWFYEKVIKKFTGKKEGVVTA